PSGRSTPSPESPGGREEGDACGPSVDTPRSQGWAPSEQRGWTGISREYSRRRTSVAPAASAGYRLPRPKDHSMSEPRILKEEVGPNGNIRALVEDDGRSVHLYLEGTSEDHPFGVRSCWVRNLRAAPTLIEAERMQAGLAPMLPARNCVDPEAGRPLRAEDLEFLWFESGDGVALLEKGDVLAVIPPWSGKAGFAGYARDCALSSP